MEVLAALFALLPFGGIVGLVMLLVWVGNKQNQQRQAVWAETARRMQMEYRYDRIAGVRHGQPVEVALVQRGSGKSRRTYTVVSSELRTAYDVGLTVRSHGFFEDLFLASRDVLVGDPAFDQRFIVQGDEDHRVRALLGPRLRRLLLEGLHARPSFVLSDSGFVVECQGASSHAPWLQWAIDLVARGTAELEQARQHVPPASPLAPYAAAWAAYARARGLHGLDSPLCMWGTIDGLNVLAYAVRTGRLAYALNVTLKFPRRLGLGLLVRPQQSLDGLAKLFGAQDHVLGDPPFDQAFIVKALDVAQARATLDAPLRAALLALQSSVGPVTLADDGLSVRVPYVPRDPSAIPRLVQHLTGVAEAVARKAPTDRGAGPYR